MASHQHSHRASGLRGRLGDLVRPWAARAEDLERTISTWQQRADQRRLLTRMDERMLRDIAVSRTDAESEAAKPFWRP
jgi:uncharacterized protein YjiS (DUF1127 family)